MAEQVVSSAERTDLWLTEFKEKKKKYVSIMFWG